MKRLLILFFAMLAFAACDKGDDKSTITGYDSSLLDQTLYADQTGGKGDFTFTAAGDWTTSVADLTRTSSSKVDEIWVTLDPTHGGAGTYHLRISLAPNQTGVDRKAQIRIVCGETTLTITIEQKATNQGGDIPDLRVKRIARIDFQNAYTNTEVSGTEFTTFRYEAKDRLVELKTTETESRNNTLLHTWITTTSLSHDLNTVSYQTMERVDGQAERLLDKATAQLINGRITSGSLDWISYEKDEHIVTGSDRFDLSYDQNGYLIRTDRFDDDGNQYLFLPTWTEGNYTKVVWDNGRGVDQAVYGNMAYKNKAINDLNAFLLLDSEGFDFSFGEPDKIFAHCGYMGKRSVNLATKISAKWGTGENIQTRTKEFKYEFDADGYPTKIKVNYLHPTSGQTESSETYVIAYE